MKKSTKNIVKIIFFYIFILNYIEIALKRPVDL